jgi:hypothetical protein
MLRRPRDLSRNEKMAMQLNQVPKVRSFAVIMMLSMMRCQIGDDVLQIHAF